MSIKVMGECNQFQKDIAAERNADALLRAFFRDHADELRYIAQWGDGRCGYIASVAAEFLLGPELVQRGANKKKAVISRSLAKRVFERDAYRCVSCGGYHDLTCDHIIPESKGGKTIFENLQAMCRSCNSRKGAKS